MFSFTYLNLLELWVKFGLVKNETKQWRLQPIGHANLILIKCVFNEIDDYNNNMLEWRVLARDKGTVFIALPVLVRENWSFQQNWGMLSLGKGYAEEANTYIVLGLKGKFYAGDNQKCSHISFFYKHTQGFTNRFGKLSYLDCFLSGGERYTMLERGRKTFLENIWGFLGRKNPPLRHNCHEMSFKLWAIYRNSVLLPIGRPVKWWPVSLSHYSQRHPRAIHCCLH